MSKYLIIALAAALAALGGAGWLLKLSYAENGAQKTEIRTLKDERKRAQDALKRERAISAQRRAENAALALEQATLRQSLERSLTANREWADQQVPADVQDALKETR